MKCKSTQVHVNRYISIIIKYIKTTTSLYLLKYNMLMYNMYIN